MANGRINVNTKFVEGQSRHFVGKKVVGFIK